MAIKQKWLDRLTDDLNVKRSHPCR